ncbi:hypothetical protein [Aquisalinus flavus]|uniref:DUF4760 domain-containing protein n=1 Tax=Aquisalinus flavus TaxID=1526572 RepID=A0A8J2V7J2_9PROT|nr:hypothetical protein [Aquisalinus flavus]MBD0426312.1 hypothetical protein [Aquisalinus flavus]UNE48120.1 hypothetical protein FF099_08695 [Aquisalinus flavus]GGD08949.1 hypothetical protein GCM10011342_17240 [Aquisalinus flavus]
MPYALMQSGLLDKLAAGWEAFWAFAMTFDGASFVLLIITTGGLAIGIWQTSQNMLRTQKTEQAQLYFEIASRWSAVLQKLYLVRATPPPSLEDLEKNHASCADFMKSSQWKDEYRMICNFFEDLGLLVYNRNIPIEIIRVLVTVSNADYMLMKPVLDYLRKCYRHDIYSFWNYLLKEAEKTKPLRPFRGELYEPDQTQS